jgi:hypothetical protein
VMQAYMLKKLQDELERVKNDKTAVALPAWLYAALAFLAASPLFWKLLIFLGGKLYERALRTPTRIDDMVMKKVNELLEAKLKSLDPPAPPK